jgi:hypothetical protein
VRTLAGLAQGGDTDGCPDTVPGDGWAGAPDGDPEAAGTPDVTGALPDGTVAEGAATPDGTGAPDGLHGLAEGPG